MNTEAQRLWIEALKSGEFVQGTGYLKKDDCHCVMGVLCEVYAREMHLNNAGKWFGVGRYGFIMSCVLTFPPSEVLEWAGLIRKDRRGCLPVITELMKNNDAGISFDSLIPDIERIPVG